MEWGLAVQELLLQHGPLPKDEESGVAGRIVTPLAK